MSLFSDILGHFDLSQIFDWVLSKFPKLKQLLGLGQKVLKHFTGVFDAGQHLFESFEAEIEAWKNFKEDFRFRQRVVNVEKAITKTKELVQGFVEAWKAVLDLIKHLFRKAELAGAAEVAEAATGVGLPVAIVNGIVAVVSILDTVRNIIDDAQAVLDEITRIREAVENADTIFLQQRNKRKSIKLDGGGKIRVRIGGLHSG